MKRTALTVAMVAFPFMAFAASQNTLTFKGEVAAQTCAVSVNGGSSTVVLLPVVSTSSLQKRGLTDGEISFTVEVSGCEAPKGKTPITTQFLANDVSEGHNLKNMGTAEGVAVQLVAPNGKPIELNGITRVDGLVLEEGQTEASAEFRARYISEDKVGPGSVTTSVQYSITYL
ncbi:major type 1 subunit fimbrin (pilin) [Pseudomonas sp. JAI115]|uniref:fimbrial protein n=1 Tax=Pseudomonas sp. JAI115 TaxID=2723061 RepID=UPI00161035AB|nr:fimbrial protein [Pseudomonas sp. JAI115]MBB6155237.1 major type 1 subunit fimbrin (pilin) [Pseudomonas sp. JAI115]